VISSFVSVIVWMFWLYKCHQNPSNKGGDDLLFLIAKDGDRDYKYDLQSSALFKR